MMKEASKYRNNVIAGKRKHIYSRLLDYFTTLVVSYLMFTIVYAIGARLPVFTNLINQYQTSGQKVENYIFDTHLQHYDEEARKVLDIGVDAEEYVKTAMKTTAYVYNVQIPTTESYVDVNIDETFIKDREQYKLDNLSYYFKNFKKNSEADISYSTLNSYVIDGVDYKDDLDTYQYIKIMGVDTSIYVTSDNPSLLERGGGISHFTVFTNETFEKLKHRVFLNDTSSSEVNTLYQSVCDSYIRGAQAGIREVEAKSIIYANLYQDFRGAYQNLVKAIAVTYFISYAIAFIILLIVMRLVAKEWVTVGLKVMSLGMSDMHENEPSWWQILLYHFLNFVLFASSSFISLYLIGIIGVTSLEIFPHFTLLALLLAVLVLNVLSLTLAFFNKKSYDLSTMSARLVLKDKKEFDVPVGMEDMSDEDVKEKEEK